MKNLVFGASIALVASQAAGCIISSSSDSGNDAFITASWSLKSLASNTTAPCPPGYDTAALYSQPTDANGNLIGSPIIDLFNCDAGTGTSAPLPPTTYASWIEIANHDNTSQYASSTKAYVDLTVADKSFTAAILTDGGYFGLAWNLVRASNGGALLCSDVAGITGVEAIATDVSNSSNSATDIFHCEDHGGVTGGYLTGTYTISVDALNGQNQAIGTANTITNKPIQSPNKVTDLGTVTIPITAL